MENIYKTPDSDLNTDNSSENKYNYSLYKVSGIGVATFFGTALAGGYIASRNLKSLGREKEARSVLIYSAIATFAILLIAYFIPEDIKIPDTVFSIVPLVVIVQLSNKW
ncbi:hypothetical protein OAP18_03665, partial [Gammaproteobacteria bacterium]|nr:hypothetical protein [Gammaproteobacteria bacterium]